MESIIELRHLRTLLALEETGSVSLAAERVFLTQSALSHQIRVLENYFEIPLFERKSSPIRFTPAGERLLKLGHELLPKVATAERELIQIVQGDAVELDIVSGFHADPIALLLTNRADLAIVSEAIPQAGITYQPLFSYEMVGICAPDHELANKMVWQAEDFANETLITYPVPDDMLDLLRKILLPKGINPTRRHSELTIAIVQLVASKRGIAALPYWAVMPYVEKNYVVERKITNTPLQSELYAAMREDDMNLAYLNDFCVIVRQEGFANLPGLSILNM